MGLTLKTAAERFSRDLFSEWDPLTNTFSGARLGKRFRIDRFTTIYHRPTRRSYIRLVDPEFPASGVVRREGPGQDEVYLLSETLNQDIELGQQVYENLRMAHLAMAPSGGLGNFTPVRTTGTGEDLGPVDLSVVEPAYLDLELQSATNIEENIDAVTPRFLVNHSPNVAPLHGDIFTLNGRTFLVTVPYVDGGLRLARAAELPPAYETFTYHRRSGTGSYDPVTGVVTSPDTELEFSGIIGRTVKADGVQGRVTAPSRLELFVYEHHVGFAFELGNRIDYAGQAFYVNSLLRRREEKQWKLELTR